MSFFGVRTEKNPLVTGYFESVNDKLADDEFFIHPFKGRIRMVDNGLYACEVRPVYPEFTLVVPCFFISFAGIVAFLFGFTGFGKVVFLLGVALGLVVHAFYQSTLYVWILRLQVRKLIGRKAELVRADDEVWSVVLYGKK